MQDQRRKPGQGRGKASPYRDDDVSDEELFGRDIGIDWKKLRRSSAPPENTLGANAECWMKKLPESLVPHALAEKYPRIINRIARNWDAPSAMADIFEDLLIDKRGGRKGFDMNIHEEIRELYEHYRNDHPESSLSIDIDETEIYRTGTRR